MPFLQSFYPALRLMMLLLAALLFLPHHAHAVGECPALPAPTGTIVTADSEEAIRNAVNNAVPGTTILIADGTYNLGAEDYYIWIDTPNVTLRSASGNRESVILDDNYSRTEIISIVASDVTIADLTIQRAGTHPIKVSTTDTGGHTLNTRIYNVHIIDPGEQAIKINAHAAKVNFTDDGEVACSTMELTDAGRVMVLELNAGVCYTGGVDAHWSRGWVIRDNTIKGFWCHEGPEHAEHGVHIWTGSRDTVVERNLLIDNAKGIGFGMGEDRIGRTYADNPCPGAVGAVGHYGGIIRNNMIFGSRAELFASNRGLDGGIYLDQACGAQVVHNTVAFTQPPFSAIEWRFANTDADITNNLVTHNLMDRDGHADLNGNLSNQPLSVFIDGANGDLHLADDAHDAIDAGVSLPAGLCTEDTEGQPRPMGAGRDIGADEHNDGTVNTAPMAHGQAVTVAYGSTDNPIILTGTDADDDTLTYSVTSGPVHGTISGTAPHLYYTPAAGHSGDDSLSFTASDGATDSDIAAVTITVQPVAATPDGGGSGGGGSGGCFIGAAKSK